MIILASASPRRRELLEQIGCRFSIMESSVSEINSGIVEPQEIVMRNAVCKARDIAGKCVSSAAVIGADTLVFADGRVLGKPEDEASAKEMLAFLSGKRHEVYTGIAVVKDGRCWSDYEKTSVDMAKISNAEAEAYIRTGEPLDKAGAYAIQGRAAIFVRGINGSYSNVVGLPLHCLANLCRKAGIALL